MGLVSEEASGSLEDAAVSVSIVEGYAICARVDPYVRTHEDPDKPSARLTVESQTGCKGKRPYNPDLAPQFGSMKN